MQSSLNNQVERQCLDQAYKWLKAAKRDYLAYRNEIRIIWLPIFNRIPDEPQTAVNHLAQCIEKIIKALAISSGKYQYDQLLRDFSHDSLSLYIDLMLHLVKTPLAASCLDTVQGKIFEQSKAEIYDHNESIRRLTELKNNAKLGPSSREMKEWAFEFATLPKDVIIKLMSSQRRIIKRAQIGAYLLHFIPAKTLARINIDSNKSLSILLKSFENRGFLLSDKIKELLNKEEVRPFLKNWNEEKKFLFIKHLGDFVMTGCLFSSLLYLTALTYTHAISPKYPGNPLDQNNRRRILDSESYNRKLGLVGSLIEVGKLTKITLKEAEKQVASFSEIFVILDEVSNDPTLNEPQNN
jgi:hypothetical protein